ncbi:hypothetical protein Mpet_1608 [Methanolacinia petrolearia DSM 11571]|uniref:Uncharacterized protein n=1 Tax=Methanolacinia petrolearia (strain DSM 11571 / OCM 486 / SEBR 4847) TaxID=679926 RepID=E1RGS0_METP4|nr:hypothetical protein Mpet_1608 [Methanolacinia petrolearia DSM 11571]
MTPDPNSLNFRGFYRAIKIIISRSPQNKYCVRQEDIDWKIYHIVVDENSVSADDILSKTGFDRETVTGSLKRLELSSLIEYDGETARILSLHEMLLKCSIKNAAADPESPIIIENGVIKENPNYKR